MKLVGRKVTLTEAQWDAAKAEPPPFPETAGGAAWQAIFAQMFGGLPGQVPNPAEPQ